MATIYSDFLPDLGSLNAGDVILYGNKLNSQNPNIQNLFSQGSASPYKANGLDTIGLTVTKPYIKPTTNYTAEGTPVYPNVDIYNNPLTGNVEVDKRQELLRTQQGALEKEYLGATSDISSQYNALRQTTRDVGGRNIGVLNRILGRAGGFTTTAGGTALVAKQGELDNQINQLNLAQQQALDKARLAYITNNANLLSQANSDIADIRKSIQDAQAESAKTLVESLKEEKTKTVPIATIKAAIPYISGQLTGDQENNINLIENYAKEFGVDASVISGLIESAKTANKNEEIKILEKGYNTINPNDVARLRGLGYDIIEKNGRAYAKEPKLTSKTYKGVTTWYNEKGEVVKTSGKPIIKSNEKSDDITSEDLTDEEKEFKKDLKKSQELLAKYGADKWGEAWDRVKDLYPDISNEDLDMMLNKNKYYPRETTNENNKTEDDKNPWWHFGL